MRVLLQDRVSALEKELELKEAKLASLQQAKHHSHGEVTSGGGDIPGPDNDGQSLESNISDFSNQFAHEVSKMRSWLGANGCVPVCLL